MSPIKESSKKSQDNDFEIMGNVPFQLSMNNEQRIEQISDRTNLNRPKLHLEEEEDKGKYVSVTEQIFNEPVANIKNEPIR